MFVWGCQGRASSTRTASAFAIEPRNLSLRLAVVDGGKVKAALRDVGESGQRSLRRIEEASWALLVVNRLQAVLRTTGFASGLTSREIRSFAEAMERSTLVTAEAVQDAASVLATFRSVSATPSTAPSAWRNLSTVFGQDLRGSATQLGKALEEPIQGITALRRVGVSFKSSQRELIESLVRAGQAAEAQRVILDALKQ